MAALEAEGLLHRDGRVPAQLRGDGRPPALGPRPRAPGAGRAAGLRQAQPHRRAAAVLRCPTTPTSRATCAATSRRRRRAPRATCSASTRCAASSWRRSSPTTSSTRSGPTFVSRLVAEQGAEPADVVRAYRIARDVTGAEQRWAAIERLDRRRPPGAVDAHGGRRRRSSRPTARWYLENAHGADLGTAIATGREGFGRLAGDPARARQRAAARGAASARSAELVEQGVPEELARAHAYLPGAGLRARRHRRRGVRRAHASRTSGVTFVAAGGPRADRAGSRSSSTRCR